MGEQPTGYTFIAPSEPEEQWRLPMLHRTLETLGGIQQVKKAHSYTERNFNLSIEQICERITHNSEGGQLIFDLAGFETTLWFPCFRHWEHLPYITLQVAKYDIAEPAGDPMRVELFSAAWARLCEGQGAIAAFFTMGSLDEFTYRSQFVDAIKTYDAEKLWPSRNWRTYLGPTIAEWWQQAFIEMKFNDWKVLPSGALILSGGKGYNPVYGDYDTLENAQFLITQIENHPQISGSDRLLAKLNQDIHILQENEKLPFGCQNHCLNEQVRSRLDEVRATWAFALQCAGLVGVQQLMRREARGGAPKTIEVPVIADNEHTWIFPTLHHPFDRDDPLWNDFSQGMEMQVWTLLDAAQHNPISDKPPRVVVYFWRGVSQEVREALEEMGAEVEVADHLPVLG